MRKVLVVAELLGLHSHAAKLWLLSFVPSVVESMQLLYRQQCGSNSGVTKALKLLRLVAAHDVNQHSS